MPWVKLDDSFARHPKVAALSDGAFRSHVSAICYAASELTDGDIAAGHAKTFAWKRHAAELVRAGLWEVTTTGWRIHDYLLYNPKRESVLADRAAAKQRMERLRGAAPPPSDPTGQPLRSPERTGEQPPHQQPNELASFTRSSLSPDPRSPIPNDLRSNEDDPEYPNRAVPYVLAPNARAPAGNAPPERRLVMQALIDLHDSVHVGGSMPPKHQQDIEAWSDWLRPEDLGKAKGIADGKPWSYLGSVLANFAAQRSAGNTPRASEDEPRTRWARPGRDRGGSFRGAGGGAGSEEQLAESW